MGPVTSGSDNNDVNNVTNRYFETSHTYMPLPNAQWVDREIAVIGLAAYKLNIGQSKVTYDIVLRDDNEHFIDLGYWHFRH